MTGPLLTAREAAAYLAVSVSVLRDLSRRGELPYVRLTERNTRWHRADLDAFIERRREEFPAAWVR